MTRTTTHHLVWVSLVLAMLCTATTATANTFTNDDLARHDPKRQTEQIKGLISEIFSDEPQAVIDTMTRICMCESGGRTKAGKPVGTIIHVKPDGSVLEGTIDPDDTGACQINPTTHSRHFWARNQLDPNNIVDNIRYAKALIDDKRQRGRPSIWEDWKPSQTCWD